MRAALIIVIAALTLACGTKSQPGPKITRFAAADATVARGLQGNLCYGVENASRVELNPPVERLLPSAARCFDISPTEKTTYTLTAYGIDGTKTTKSVEVNVSAPPPRLSDVHARSTEVARGHEVKICFKAENVTGVKVHPGKLDSSGTCLTDRPSKTTTYKITALGRDREMDSAEVTVKVR